MCVKLSSSLKPSMSIDDPTGICSESMINLTSVLFNLCLVSTMAWNLPGFTIILCSGNHLMATSNSDSND